MFVHCWTAYIVFFVTSDNDNVDLYELILKITNNLQLYVIVGDRL